MGGSDDPLAQVRPSPYRRQLGSNPGVSRFQGLTSGLPVTRSEANNRKNPEAETREPAPPHGLATHVPQRIITGLGDTEVASRFFG